MNKFLKVKFKYSKQTDIDISVNQGEEVKFIYIPKNQTDWVKVKLNNKQGFIPIIYLNKESQKFIE